MVFLMHLGFAALESGMTQSKNTVNILFKNVSIVAIGLLTYAAVGFNLMYPGGEFAGKFFGFAGFGISTDAAGLTSAYADYTYWTDFIFQAMFAATAATIVSGAVAERIKLGSFLIFSTIYVSTIYPIIGMWHWGGGWLAEMGFHDFAGSTLVHAVGGWGALAGVIVLGPRIGKYVNGAIKPIMGHNMPLAAIGVFLLWFGWYGFNGGSVLSADPASVSLVVVTTSLAAAAGVLAASLTAQVVLKTLIYQWLLTVLLLASLESPLVQTRFQLALRLSSVLLLVFSLCLLSSLLTARSSTTQLVRSQFTWCAVSGARLLLASSVQTRAS